LLQKNCNFVTKKQYFVTEKKDLLQKKKIFVTRKKDLLQKKKILLQKNCILLQGKYSAKNANFIEFFIIKLRKRKHIRKDHGTSNHIKKKIVNNAYETVVL